MTFTRSARAFSYFIPAPLNGIHARCFDPASGPAARDT
jgi:hypothetical protein